MKNFSLVTFISAGLAVVVVWFLMHFLFKYRVTESGYLCYEFKPGKVKKTTAPSTPEDEG